MVTSSMALGAETVNILNGIFTEIQKQTRTLEEEYKLLEEQTAPGRDKLGRKTAAQYRRERRAADEDARTKVKQARIVRNVNKRFEKL